MEFFYDFSMCICSIRNSLIEIIYRPVEEKTIIHIQVPDPERLKRLESKIEQIRRSTEGAEKFRTSGKNGTAKKTFLEGMTKCFSRYSHLTL